MLGKVYEIPHPAKNISQIPFIGDFIARRHGKTRDRANQQEAILWHILTQRSLVMSKPTL